MKNAANKNFGRLTAGPLYSQAELQSVMDSLLDDGYLPALGVEGIGGARTMVKAHDRSQSVTICLDELGCNPGLSGTMYFSQADGNVTTDTVWDYARRKNQQNESNSIKKLIKKFQL